MFDAAFDAGNSIPGACFEAALDTECVTDIEVKTCKICSRRTCQKNLDSKPMGPDKHL